MENKGVKKGLWKPEEDLILKTYVETHGEGNWATVSAKSGLMRGGKSCRLRWKNYLRPNIKHGRMTQEEVDLIIRMHRLVGNRWSLIAGRIPGRTDNEVKNYWNTHLNKRFPTSSKRKTIDSNNQNNKSDDKSGNKRKRLRGLSTTMMPICSSSSPKTTTDQQVVEKIQEKEDSRLTDSWIQDAKTLNYYIESPMVPAYNAAFAFDDEPFITNLDPLVLFESTDVQMDMPETQYSHIHGA